MFFSIFHRLQIWLSYLAIVFFGTLAFLFFRFPLNFTRVKGKENIPRQGSGIIFVANHKTMYDSFPIGVAAFFFRLIFYPSEPFVNFAAKENYFQTWYFRALMKLLRTEPVKSRDHAMLMKRYVELLKKRNLLIFYQGTRSDNLDLIKDGAAFAIQHAKPTPVVVPVYHEGMDRIFSRGGPNTRGTWRWLPRNLFRRPTVIFGPPIDFSDAPKNATTKEVTEFINHRIVASVKRLKAGHEQSL